MQNPLLSTRISPGLSVFAQEGYGRPALTRLRDTFDFLGLLGTRLNCNFGTFYILKNDRELFAKKIKNDA